MRSRAERWVANTILVFVGLCILGCVISSLRTQTDSVRVTAIDDGYDISISSEGRYMMPLTPEGPFPKWSRGARLFAEGSGESVEIDGLSYKKYSVGKDLIAANYSSGSVYISEKGKRLLTRELEGNKTFDNITIEHPKIILLTRDTTIEELDHCYIRARGRFNDWKFNAAGKTFEIQNYPYGDSREYNVIGVVMVDYFKSPGHLPYLGVIWSKPVEGK
jgi:hypothetical protein